MNGQSESLKSLLLHIRQHPGYPELLKSVEVPRPPEFKPNTPETPEQFGGKAIHVSGARAQHNRWLSFLTGQPTSQQE